MRDEREQGDGGSDAVRLSRPVLRTWADDIVWLEARAGELPVAYVSMALRQVFVDREYRDRASWLLDAHISVSTAHWRIRLPGDPPRQPITPGDEVREFEELSIREWDPSMPPAMDDIRIRRGRATLQHVDFSCAPVLGSDRSDAWCSAGPFSFRAAGGPRDDTVREDFAIVGTGLRFAERECASSGDAVQLLSWAVREG